jgi:hypothetical protein
VSWTSNVWHISNAAGRVQVETCSLEGLFSAKQTASNPEAAEPSRVSQRAPDSIDGVTLLAEFDKLSQWDCFGTTVTLRSREFSEALVANGCKWIQDIQRGTEVKIHPSPRVKCQNVHSVLEWSKTTLNCEGNDLSISLRDGKTPLRPNWWASVAK